MPHSLHPPEKDCEVCTRRRRRMREGYRERVKAGLGPGDERHGTANGYLNYGCRCESCKNAGALYNSAQARRRRRFGRSGSVRAISPQDRAGRAVG